MYGFENSIEDEIGNINFLIDQLEDRPGIDLEGSLVYKKVKGDFYYYRQYYVGKTKKYDYLGKHDSDKVTKFKTDKFNTLRLKMLKKDLSLLERLQKKYVSYQPSEIHGRLPSSYKDLPDECYIDEKFEKLHAWAEVKYDTNPIPFARSGCTTVDGTKVRSKGECIWYDTLCRHQIPFRYESALVLRDEHYNEVTVHPDFTLTCYNDREIYIEHLGMLLNWRYMKDFERKTVLYLHNDIVIGDNLFITSDNADSGINAQMIDLFVKNMMKPLVFGGEK